ncbi:MAG: hypothetical protein K940chlam2_00720 [Chlamydiae bacterium]|nr:hypothetical protein [Chlamydiota bacterium]
MAAIVPPRGPLRWIAQGAGAALNAGARVVNVFRPPQPSPEVCTLTERDVQMVRLRMGAQSPTDEEIQVEADLFATHTAHMVGMRMVDTYFGIEKPEAFYLALEGNRDAYFNHLNESDLCFLSRWVAKLAYRIFEWFGQGAIKDATLSLFEVLGGRIEALERCEFNEMMEFGVNRTNMVLGKWTELIKGVTSHPEKSDRVVELLDQEINAPNKAFYREITIRLIDKHFKGVSIGKLFFNLLMKKVGFSEDSCLSWFNFIFRIALFPIALLIRMLFVIPDHVLSDYITLKAKRMMIEDQVLENLVQEFTEGVTGNKALSIPVFTALNEALEELLLDLTENPNDHEELDRLKGFLSPENKALIGESVRLAEESLNLFACETVEEVEESIRQGPGVKGTVKRAIQAEKAQGIEDVILLLHHRLTDSKYLKDKLYGLVQGLNGAFSAEQMTEAEQEAEFEKVEGRFFKLINAVIAKSIENAVRLKLGAGAAADLVQAEIFQIAFAEVEKMIKMGTSAQFLNFVVKEALEEFFVPKTA